MQAWWMDAVCFGNKEWDVLLYEKNGIILGALPFHFITKLGFKFVLQPQLTQYNGIWIDYPEKLNSSNKLSLEKEIYTDLIKKLEELKLDYFEQNFPFSFTNWLPFYWKGFTQTTRYSFVIENIINTEKVFSLFDSNKKAAIRKIANNVKVDVSLDGATFYHFQQECLEAKRKKILYPQVLLERIFSAAKERNQAQILGIRDSLGELHAAIFLVWDNNTAYNLITAIHPKYKSSGASTLMFWEAIQFLSDKTKAFDFEGSMVQNIAQSNQHFGAEMRPYFTISKSYSKCVSFLVKMKKKWN